ncbi:MAG: hypothetical protein ACHQM4_11690, partial [Thermoanaerobaculia bacterium]
PPPPPAGGLPPTPPPPPARAPAGAPPAAALGQTAAAPSLAPAPTLLPTPEAPSSVAEALTEVARIRWGKHLSGGQLGEIAIALDARLRGAEAMKKFPLTNADEPDVVFFAEIPGDR